MTPITLAQTAYKVGKGYFDEIAEKLEPAADDSPERSRTNRQCRARRPAELEISAAENDRNAVADCAMTALPRRGSGRVRLTTDSPGGQVKT